ncbi:hypothetical protein [Leptospira mayottensis]|uniref:hypothetical protein n=1 Tax=Leptospira mayottensis TaxID=1137606 RepID=UPI0020B115C9|nr:hypothetical protein [Leptospira mayottensis]
MQKIILILILTGCNNPEFRYIAAGRGLILRNSPNPNATVMPFNSKLKIQKQLSDSMIIDQVEGHWVKAEFGEYTGFVFSPYLSEVSIPEKPKVEGSYLGVYGSDDSIYGKLELKENNTGVLTLNFCHNMAFPKIQWERRGYSFYKVKKGRRRMLS